MARIKSLAAVAEQLGVRAALNLVLSPFVSGRRDYLSHSAQVCHLNLLAASYQLSIRGTIVHSSYRVLLSCAG